MKQQIKNKPILDSFIPALNTLIQLTSTADKTQSEVISCAKTQTTSGTAGGAEAVGDICPPSSPTGTEISIYNFPS